MKETNVKGTTTTCECVDKVAFLWHGATVREVLFLRTAVTFVTHGRLITPPPGKKFPPLE